MNINGGILAPKLVIVNILTCQLENLYIRFFNFRMAATTFNGCIGTIKSHRYINNYAFHQEVGNSSLRLISNSFKIYLGVSRNERCRKRGAVVIQASSFQTTTIVLDQVSTPLNTNGDSPKKTSMVSSLVNGVF